MDKSILATLMILAFLVHTLMELFYENGWQRVKTVTTETDLEQDAEQMWKNAGFTVFLHDVVYKLTTGSTHECMRTAIKTAKNCMEQLSFYPK